MPTRAVKFESGFTLIELVAGMLVLGIGLVMMATMLYPQADRAAESLHRMRATELAQSVMNEIWNKKYDPNTGNNGAQPACGSNELGALPCLNRFSSLSGQNRNDYDSLDDYNGLNQNSLMLDSNQTYAQIYPNYRLAVSVSAGAASNTKLITISVTAPNNETIVFNALRSNY